MGSNKNHPYKLINVLLDLLLQSGNSWWKGKKNLFHPEGHQCPTKFSLNYVTYGKGSFEIILTPPQGLQNASWSQVGYLVGMIGLSVIRFITVYYFFIVVNFQVNIPKINMEWMNELMNELMNEWINEWMIDYLFTYLFIYLFIYYLLIDCLFTCKCF